MVDYQIHLPGDPRLVSPPIPAAVPAFADVRLLDLLGVKGLRRTGFATAGSTSS